MSEAIRSWQAIAEGFAQRLDAVSADQWEARTPCDQWSVRELVEHTIDVQRGFPGQLGADASAELGDNPAAAWRQIMAAASAAYTADGAAEQEVQSPFGARPLGEAIGIATTDLMVHTWDLARAINADDTLPEPIAAHALETLTPMDAMMRGEGMFGPKIEVGDDASVQDRLIGFLGRQP
ncbi:MAG: TIGR03086 family protein [Actinomycetia bacterium]|nr:TIGR03086 family protein [Actinomycetes bacterium]MCP4085067.1 TIGR03086 family protein [Actinomycetes bacterium]